METIENKEYNKLIKDFKKLIEKSKIKLPCENFPLYCVRLGVILAEDIKVLVNHTEKGKCDFFHKCKERKDSCGINIPPRSNFNGNSE